MKSWTNALCIILFPALFALQSCKNSSGGKVKAVTSDTARFYPVKEYLLQQIKQVDSSAVSIYKITVENGRQDSSVIDKQQFNALAQIFVQYDISDKRVHNYYKENVFLDETTHSYTFNYTSADTSLPLKSVDVLLDMGSTQVKRIFMNITENTGGHTVTEKVGWKSNDRFFINRVTEIGDSTTVQQNIIVWHNQP